jgi:hypothetical protein
MEKMPGTSLGDNFDLLPVAVLALAHRRLQPLYHPLLQPSRTGDDQLHLPTMRAHQLAKLLTYSLQQPQPVIIRQRPEEVLHRPTFVGAGAGVSLQLGDDGGFVGLGEGWGVEDGGELWVGFQHLVQRDERSGHGVEGRGFGGGGILEMPRKGNSVSGGEEERERRRS